MSNSPPQKIDPTVDSRTVNQITCPSCEHSFPAHRAPRINYRGGEDAEYTCPECATQSTHQPPETYIERPPTIVDHSLQTDEEGLRTARLFFEGGAWLQFRQAPRGWVREEMFDEQGHETASLKAEIRKDACRLPTDYLIREVQRYPTYTTTGLRIQRPHIAAVLLHDRS